MEKAIKLIYEYKNGAQRLPKNVPNMTPLERNKTNNMGFQEIYKQMIGVDLYIN